MTDKSSTDLHWNERALHEPDPVKVNIADDAQRQLETEFILANLPADARILEVGCGNGHLTAILRQKCAFVDAFDYAENMVAKAVELQGQTNNRFFHDSVLAPKNVQGPYDAVVCVRVLINLRDLDEQRQAFQHMARLLRPGGQLILIEGYLEGFEGLNALRQNCGLEPLKPAAINFYSRFQDWLSQFEADFDVTARFHTGCFDFLTRVVYPSLVGAGQATGPADFHHKVLPVAKAFNPSAFEPLARLHGVVLRSKSVA